MNTAELSRAKFYRVGLTDLAKGDFFAFLTNAEAYGDMVDDHLVQVIEERPSGEMVALEVPYNKIEVIDLV